MTPLVLLPGMMCDARLFQYQIDYFSIEREILVLPITGQDSIAQIAHDVLSKAPEKFALAGLSMGGIVAMEIMAISPERVERLALLDTNPLAELSEISQNRLRQIQKVQAGHLDDVMRDEMKPLYLAMSHKREEHLVLCMDMAMSLGPDVFIRQSTALAARSDQTQTLRAINSPTLLLCGEDDILCPVSRHKYMQDQIKEARLIVIENAGHLPTLENPQATNIALADWLSW